MNLARKVGTVLGGVVGGLVAFTAVASLGERWLRAMWPAYAAAAPDLAYDGAMKAARLALGAGATLAAGLAASAVAGVLGRRLRASVAPGVTGLWTGLALLAAFVPVHVGLWARFPVWYHLAFLGSLVPLAVIGARRTGPGKIRRGALPPA
jgi:xanthine/uracil permease